VEKSVSPLKIDNGQNFAESQCFRCEECGEEFHEPILATVSSGLTAKEYYACPRCLSKVNDAEEIEDKEGEKQPEERKDLNIVEKSEGDIGCSHELGYLKKRPRDMPIPEECLVCDKMIECLTF
jgi:DNA-directed RNA polymerase subunit RPC12/RpoP